MSPAPSVSTGRIRRTGISPRFPSSTNRIAEPPRVMATRRIFRAREKFEDIALAAATGRAKVSRTDRGVEQRQQLRHARLPASAVEHDRDTASVCRLRRCNAQRHVLTIQQHDRDAGKPSRIELCADRREHGGIRRDHGSLAGGAMDHDRRNRRRLTASTRHVVQADRGVREIVADHRRQRMRADSRDQRRSAAEEGEGCSRIGGRTAGCDQLCFDGDLLIAPRNFVDGVADIDGRQADEEAGGTVIAGACGFHAGRTTESLAG